MDRRILNGIAAGGQYRGFQATVLGANAAEFLRDRRDEMGAFFRYRCISLVDALGSGAPCDGKPPPGAAVPRTRFCSRRL